MLQLFKAFWTALVPQLVRCQNFVQDLFLFPGHKPSQTNTRVLVQELGVKREPIKDMKASKRLE